MHDYPAPAHSDAATLSQNAVAILAETFRLLGDPSRLRIVLACLNGPIPVSEIAERLGPDEEHPAYPAGRRPERG